MSNVKSGLSRRRFLGGSAMAVGGLSVGMLDRRVLAQMAARQTEVSQAAPPLSEIKPPATPDEAFWWRIRSHFNIVDRMTFMNNGTQGPMPRLVVDENIRVLREIAEDPSDNYRREDIDIVRGKIAAFVGAQPEEIAITRSTSEGMNYFAHGLDWKEGDEVLVNNHEHGGGLGPYRTLEKRKGIKIVTLEVSKLSPFQSVDQIVGLYEKAITPRTRVIMVSHMPYVTGTVMPIKELADLAHRRNLLISVDGAHPLGMLNLNMKESGVDHYAAAGQKWLLSGTGTGICFVKREVQDRVWPIMGGPGDPKMGAAKYESFGQRNVPSVMGMGMAVAFHSAIGKQNIENRDRELGSRLRKGLMAISGVKVWTPDDPKLSAGLTLFSVGNIPMANVQKAIMDRDRVWIRTMGTGNLNGCRASTAFYNFPHEVDRLLDSVKYIASNASKYMTPTAAAAMPNFDYEVDLG